MSHHRCHHHHINLQCYGSYHDHKCPYSIKHQNCRNLSVLFEKIIINTAATDPAGTATVNSTTACLNVCVIAGNNPHSQRHASPTLHPCPLLPQLMFLHFSNVIIVATTISHSTMLDIYTCGQWGYFFYTNSSPVLTSTSTVSTFPCPRHSHFLHFSRLQPYPVPPPSTPPPPGMCLVETQSGKLPTVGRRGDQAKPCGETCWPDCATVWERSIGARFHASGCSTVATCLQGFVLPRGVDQGGDRSECIVELEAISAYPCVPEDEDIE